MRRVRIALLSIMLAVLGSPAVRAQSVTIIDTVYTPPAYDDGPLMASIYVPPVQNGAGMILTHWYGGTRQTMRPWCEAMAANGYVAMAIDYYGFSDAVRGVYPKPVRAFKTAVEFLRRNAGRFGIRSGKIVGLGQSEGAIHWGQSMIWDNDDAYFRTDPTVDDRLNAAVLLYGLYDNNNNLQGLVSLDQWLTSSSPRALLFAPQEVTASTTPQTLPPLP